MISIPAGIENYVNIGLLIFFGIMSVMGYAKGFLRTIVGLIGGVAALYAGYRYSSIAKSYFHLWPTSATPLKGTLMEPVIYDYLNQFAWFLVIFLAVTIVFYLLGKLVNGVQELPVLKQVSGILGAAFGLVSATIWVLVACVILKSPLFLGGETLIQNTYLTYVQQETATLMKMAGIESGNDLINTIYTSTSSLSDQDQKALQEYLEKNGYEKVDGTDGFSSKSTAEPEPTSTPTESAAS